MNIFDMIGPVMIGPSSSHTAGAARIALMARQLLGGRVESAEIALFGSFAHTCMGHGTIKALIGGLLGLGVDDIRLRDSISIAHESGLEFKIVRSSETVAHPNTAEITMHGEKRSLTVRGCSIGGGQVRLVAIEGVEVRIESGMAGLIVFHTDARGVLAQLTSALADARINIAGMSDFRRSRAGDAISVFEMDQKPDDELIQHIGQLENVQRAVWLDGQMAQDESNMAPPTLRELADMAEQHDYSIAHAILDRQCETLAMVESEIRAELLNCLEVMRTSIADGLQNCAPSPSGLSGGDAMRFNATTPSLLGGLAHNVLASALAVPESNARMGRIVAAPTAGSCGVLPAIIINVGNQLNADDNTLCDALLTAAGIGMTIAHKASIAGAEGGCQAECGAAAAMAAGAAAQLLGGSPVAVIHAAALTVKSMLGLVCDPVAGLVEVPCIKRNAFSAMTALTACELALSGIRSKVEPDEVIDAMRDVGRRLPMELKETALGGLAKSSAGETAEKWLAQSMPEIE